jgi:hypothetical protein
MVRRWSRSLRLVEEAITVATLHTLPGELVTRLWWLVTCMGRFRGRFGTAVHTLNNGSCEKKQGGCPTSKHTVHTCDMAW